jgi:hypothetical protein
MNFEDIFGDPDFTEFGLVGTRNVQQIVKGRATNYPTEFYFDAVVIDGEDMTERRPEGSRADEVITLYTAYDLIAGATEHDADVITRGGLRYIVKSLTSYKKLGGYVVAMCVRLNDG